MNKERNGKDPHHSLHNHTVHMTAAYCQFSSLLLNNLLAWPWPTMKTSDAILDHSPPSCSRAVATSSLHFMTITIPLTHSWPFRNAASPSLSLAPSPSPGNADLLRTRPFPNSLIAWSYLLRYNMQIWSLR